MATKKPDLTKEQLLKHYSNILIAMQGLYYDCHLTADRQLQLENELHDIKKLLIEILKYHKSLEEIESKIFRDNLKH